MEKKLILKKAMVMMFAKKKQVQVDTQGPLIGYQMEKRNMYLHHQVEKKYRGQTDSFLIEMKERMNTLKTLAWILTLKRY